MRTFIQNAAAARQIENLTRKKLDYGSDSEHQNCYFQLELRREVEQAAARMSESSAQMRQHRDIFDY